MADISEITAYLANVAVSAVYPSGTGQPSVANMDCIVYEGWPIPEQLDLDLTGRMLSGTPPTVVPRPGGLRANVSIFPMAGMNVVPPQILDETYVIAPPVYGLTASMTTPPSGTTTFTITLNGVPGTTEFLTIELDNIYIASSTGASNTAILAALAAQINAFPSLINSFVPGYVATVVGANKLTISGAAYCVPRLGVQATLAKVIHKQKQNIMVTVWAPDHASRSAFAAAIDILIKQNLTVTMPDTSMALIVYNRTNVIDEFEPVACYRRDLIYQVEYATLWQFPGTVITSVSIQIAPLDPVNQNYIVVTGVA